MVHLDIRRLAQESLVLVSGPFAIRRVYSRVYGVFHVANKSAPQSTDGLQLVGDKILTLFHCGTSVAGVKKAAAIAAV
jgi:hypothetical protein